MRDSVGGRDVGEFVLVWEELGGPRDAYAIGFRDEKAVAAVMFRGRTKVPGKFSMWAPTFTSIWVFKNYSPCARWRKGGPIEVKESMELCMCRQSRIHSRGAEEIQGEDCLGD
jgi:hypothetical protein